MYSKVHTWTYRVLSPVPITFRTRQYGDTLKHLLVLVWTDASGTAHVTQILAKSTQTCGILMVQRNSRSHKTLLPMVYHPSAEENLHNETLPTGG